MAEHGESSSAPSTPEVRDVVIVNRTADVEKRALQKAEKDIQQEHQRIKDERRSLGGLRQAHRHIRQHLRLGWQQMKLHRGEEYFRQRGADRLRTAMLENDNAYMTMDTFNGGLEDATHRISEEREAAKAKIEQVKMADQVQEDRAMSIAELNGDIKQRFIEEVIRPGLDGSLNADNVQEQLREFARTHQSDADVQRIFGRKATQFGKTAEYFATDVLEIIDVVKADIDAHKYGSDAIKDHLRVRIANADWAADSKTRLTIADKILKNRVAASVLNSTTVGAIVSVGSFVKFSGAGRALRALGMGVGAGAVVRGIERWRETGKDMASHRIDVQYGMQTPADATQRQKFDRYTYQEMASVGQLLEGGRDDARAFGDARGLKDLLNLDLSVDGNRRALALRVAEIQERLRYSSQEQIAFLQYEGQGKVEQGRLALLKGIVEGKQKLTDSYISEGLDPTRARELADTAVREDMARWQARFTTDKKQQDRAFVGFRVRSSLAHAAVGGAAGFVFGITTQEAFVMGSRGVSTVSDFVGGPRWNTQPSIVEQFFGKDMKDDTVTHERQVHLTSAGSHTTGEDLLSGKLAIPGTHWVTQGEKRVLIDNSTGKALFSGVGTAKAVEEAAVTMAPDSMKDHIADILQMKIPNGSHWAMQEGKFNLVSDSDPTKVLIRDAHIGSDGQFAYDYKASILNDPTKYLRESGGAITTQHEAFGPDGLWEKYGTKAIGTEWLGNDTKNSDLNELRFHTHLRNDGKTIVLKAQGMTPGGSFNSSLNPSRYNMPDLINRGAGVAVFNIPGVSEKVIVPLDQKGEFALDLTDTNPNHTVTVITAQGKTGLKQVPMSHIAQLMVDRDKLQSLKLKDGDIATEVHPERRSIFRLGADGKRGTINVGTLKWGANGRPVVVSAATIFGNGDLADKVTTQGHALEILPPPTEMVRTTEHITTFEIPAVPFVYSPRKALEPTEEPPPPVTPYRYGYGYGESMGPVRPVSAGTTDVLRPAADVLGLSGNADSTTGREREEIDRVELALVDESDSPVSAPDRADAVRRLHDFVDSREIEDSSLAGGLTKGDAARLYRGMLDWLKDKEVTELEVDDTSINPETLAKVQDLVDVFYDGDDAERNHKRANIIAKYVQQIEQTGAADLTQGNEQLNLYAIITLFDSVKDLTGKDVAEVAAAPSYGEAGGDTRPVPGEAPDVLASATDVVEPSPETPPAGPESEEISRVELALADETRSPIAVRDRADAIRRLHDFVASREVEDSTLAGGLTKGDAARLYQGMLDWLKTRNIVDLERDDTTLPADTLSKVEDMVNIFYSEDDADTNHRRTNLIVKFIRDNTSADLTRGNQEFNWYALVVLYDKVKDFTLV